MSSPTLPEEAGACGGAGGGVVVAAELLVHPSSFSKREVRSRMSASIQACCSGEKRGPLIRMTERLLDNRLPCELV